MLLAAGGASSGLGHRPPREDRDCQTLSAVADLSDQQVSFHTQSWVYSQEFLCFSSSAKEIKDSLIWGREVVWRRTPVSLC